jgi:hypothetical protein
VTGPVGVLAAAPWEEWEPTGVLYLVMVAAAALVLAAPWLWRAKEGPS